MQSCNAYFAQLAVDLGPQPLMAIASRFRIPLAADSDSAQRVSDALPQVGYGQAQVVASPLRLASVAASIADDGRLRLPYVDQDAAGASRAESILDPAAARQLNGYMRDVVTSGTGRSLRGHAVAIAGKTGTAEVAGRPSHGWFVGFAPYGGEEAHRLRRRHRACRLRRRDRGAGGRRDRRSRGGGRVDWKMTMDFLRKARDLEAKIAGKFDRTMGDLVQSGSREPLEIVHAIVEAVLEEIQSSGRGRRVFPFNSIALTILAPSRDARARFEAVIADGPPLGDRILARLRSAGCPSDDLDVNVTYETKPRRGWRTPDFHVEFARIEKATAPAPVAVESRPLRVELSVVHGTAERRTYALAAADRIDLGRCPEVRDSQHRLIRTNHVAFVERAGDANQTVSRRHAHLSYEPSSRQFRLHDDGSEHGTSIVRNGRTVAVPRGTRGVRVDTGDEIVLGDARLKVRIVPEPQ